MCIKQYIPLLLITILNVTAVKNLTYELTFTHLRGMMGLNEVTHKNITQIRSESVWAQGFVQMSDRSPLLHEGRLPHAYAVLLKPLYHWGLHAQRILIVNILCCVSCPKGGRYYSECIRHLELSAC